MNEPVAPSNSNADLARFNQVFREGKAYLEHGLSVAGLAQKLPIPQYRLRKLINSELGYRNFNALLHDYRLTEAALRLSDPARNGEPILTIALSVGYSSIAPFNQAFREKYGATPSAWRGAQQTVANKP